MLSEGTAPPRMAERPEDATRLSVFLGLHDKINALPAYEAMCELLYRRGVPGATVFLGVDGISHGHRPQGGTFSYDLDLPVMIVAVGPGDRIGPLLPELSSPLRRPVVTLERIRICKRSGQFISVPELSAETDDRGSPFWHKLTIYTSEAARHKGQPIHRAIIRRLRSAGIAGATTHRGVWGFGERPPHGDRFLQTVRHVPTVTTVVETEDRIFTAFDIIDELTSEHGLVTSESVSAIQKAKLPRLTWAD